MHAFVYYLTSADVSALESLISSFTAVRDIDTRDDDSKMACQRGANCTNSTLSGTEIGWPRSLGESGVDVQRSNVRDSVVVSNNERDNSCGEFLAAAALARIATVAASGTI